MRVILLYCNVCLTYHIILVQQYQHAGTSAWCVLSLMCVFSQQYCCCTSTGTAGASILVVGNMVDDCVETCNKLARSVSEQSGAAPGTTRQGQGCRVHRAADRPACLPASADLVACTTIIECTTNKNTKVWRTVYALMYTTPHWPIFDSRGAPLR